MARKPKITRTITSTKAYLLCLDIESAEPCNEEIILPRTYKNNEAILKAVNEKWTNELVKPVHVVGSEIVTKKYAMDEDVFVENAVEI